MAAKWPAGLFSVFGLYYVCVSVCKDFSTPYMGVHVGVCGCMWVHMGALNEAPHWQSRWQGVLRFWFVLWVGVGTIDKMANYGWISKFKVCMEVS